MPPNGVRGIGIWPAGSAHHSGICCPAALPLRLPGGDGSQWQLVLRIHRDSSLDWIPFRPHISRNPDDSLNTGYGSAQQGARPFKWNM